MISFVRNFFSSAKPEDANFAALKDLHTGYSVGFGFMPQSLLSGRRFKVGEVNTYRFGEDAFLSYSLTHESVNTPIQMIAELSDEDSYLALTMQLDVDDQRQLFGREISSSDSIFLQDKIVLNSSSSSHLIGWTENTYKKVIDGVKGEFIRGHYQLSGEDSAREPWGFRYSLFVSDANDYGVEFEQYDHGHTKVSLTVFRPISDIGQIRKPATKLAPISSKPIRSTLPTREDTMDGVIAHEPIVTSPIMVLSADKEVDAKVVPIDVVVPEMRKVTAAAPAAHPPTNISNPSFNLPCPASVAARLIEESERNRIPLSQVMRKILGLDVHVDEMVMIPLNLTESDIRQLSSKFGVDAKNPDSLRQFLLKEVSLFVGEKLPDSESETV